MAPPSPRPPAARRAAPRPPEDFAIERRDLFGGGRTRPPARASPGRCPCSGRSARAAASSGRSPACRRRRAGRSRRRSASSRRGAAGGWSPDVTRTVPAPSAEAVRMIGGGQPRDEGEQHRRRHREAARPPTAARRRASDRARAPRSARRTCASTPTIGRADQDAEQRAGPHSDQALGEQRAAQRPPARRRAPCAPRARPRAGPSARESGWRRWSRR